MNTSLLQTFAGLAMLVVAFALVVAYRKYLAAGSERRMKSMLESVGLDPALAASGDTDAVVNEIRRRCETCSAEDVCEHWLAGDKADDNRFCPNAEVLEQLRKTGATAT